MLVLRTGILANRGYSRGRVARLLQVSLTQEGAIEHHAVAALRSASKGGCPLLRVNLRSGLLAAASELSQAEQALSGTPAASAPSGSQRHPRQRARPRHAPPNSVSAVSTHVQGGGFTTPAHSGPGTTLWLLIVAGLLAATGVATPVAWRRRRPHGAPAPVGATAAAVTAAATTAAAATAAATHSAAAERLEREGDADGALDEYRRADAGGDAAAATNLGVMLEQRGDHDGAIAAYRRADERGDANGSFNLGCLLAERGDARGAISALRRADEQGDGAAASNLGVLLEQQGDAAGALTAYRRADARGDANGSFNLGLLLASRGDVAGARTAYRRASERGDPDVAERARSALMELDGQDEA